MAAEEGPLHSHCDFHRCYTKLLTIGAADDENFKTEVNLVFDQLISENYLSDSSISRERQALEYGLSAE